LAEIEDLKEEIIKGKYERASCVNENEMFEKENRNLVDEIN